MSKLIIFNDKHGEIVRIGLYENNKWVKWIPKKQLDKWVETVDDLENQTI